MIDLHVALLKAQTDESVRRCLLDLNTILGLRLTMVLYSGNEAVHVGALDSQFNRESLRELEHPARLLDAECIERRGDNLSEYTPPKPN